MSEGSESVCILTGSGLEDESHPLPPADPQTALAFSKVCHISSSISTVTCAESKMCLKCARGNYVLTADRNNGVMPRIVGMVDQQVATSLPNINESQTAELFEQFTGR